MTDTLLPCPFCGCDCIDEYEGDFGNVVYCMQCGVMMGEPIHLDFRSPRVSIEQAIAAWNTRTERTCHLSEKNDICSSCGACIQRITHSVYDMGDGYACRPSYCPSCGAKVVD